MVSKSSNLSKCQIFGQFGSPRQRVEYFKYILYTLPNLLWLLFSISFLAVVLFAFNLRLLYNVTESTDELPNLYIHKRVTKWMSWSEKESGNESLIHTPTTQVPEVSGK